MDLQNWYFEQLVTEADLNDQFGKAQDADHFIQTDNGYIGVARGLDVVQNSPIPNLTVNITDGVAYDQTGQRTAIPALVNLDVSVDSNGVSTAVGGPPGNQKYISVFIQFTWPSPSDVAPSRYPG